MPATSQPFQVLRTAIGRTSFAILLTILIGGIGHSPLAAQSLASTQVTRGTTIQIQTWVLAQNQNQKKKQKPRQKADSAPKDGAQISPELARDKEALPPDYRVPPAAAPELSISKELPIPDKTDKVAWRKHTSRMSEYSKVLVKGTFGDEKVERDALRYGIVFRLNKMTQRSILFPSDEERAKVVDPEKTKPEAPETLISVREELISDLRKTNSSSDQFQVRDAFLDIFVEEAPKLLDNNTYVRFQIGYLLATFNNRDENKERQLPEIPCFRATKALISIVNDDKILFGSKVFPIKGLARICRHKDCKPEDRFLIMETLIKQMELAKTLHSWYGETVAENLCQIGDPLDRAKQPAVAEVLFAVVKDKAYSDRVRVRAAHSLSRIPLESFKRTDEIAIEFLRLGDQLAQAYEKDPKSVHWREAFMLLYLAFQHENLAEKNERKGLLIQVETKPALAGSRTVVNEAYQNFLPLVQNVIGVKGVTPIPDQLRKIKTWLDAHNGKNGATSPVAVGSLEKCTKAAVDDQPVLYR